MVIASVEVIGMVSKGPVGGWHARFEKGGRRRRRRVVLVERM